MSFLSRLKRWKKTKSKKTTKQKNLKTKTVEPKRAEHRSLISSISLHSVMGINCEETPGQGKLTDYEQGQHM